MKGIRKQFLAYVCHSKEMQETKMDYQTIKLENEGPVAVIRLNRPTRMNAVIEQMYVELLDAITSVSKDNNVRAVVLTGSVLERDGQQKQAFCAGADLKKHSTGERTHAQKREYILLAHETTRRLYVLDKPVIAAINGPARGAGVEMALNCDFVFIAKEATLAFSEIGLGTFVGGGVTRHLPRLVGMARAKELIYSGRVINGDEAVEIGLAVRSMPVATLERDALDFALTLAQKAPISLRFAKQRLQQPEVLDLDTVLHMEAEAILTCMDTADWQEGLDAFASKRKPVFKGE